MDPVTAGAFSYPDSVDSSPRSRGGESWDELYPSSGPRLLLMFSYGGRIVPRPTDKSLCYLGGETRIVVVERNSPLSDLHSKLSRSLLLNNSPFTLKYQLPNEDLDSLISLTTDEDLDNMIDEYDRIQSSSSLNSTTNSAATVGGGSNKSSRIRLFLFPTNPESAPSSIGSLLGDSKSETWFVDALNGAMGIGNDGLPACGSTDSASVNCLLDLEDDSSVHSRAGAGSNSAVGGGGVDADRMVLPRPDSSGKLGRQVQDVKSVPDSPMLETTSSFGSTSSAPVLSNLPPIRVRPDDRPPDSRYGNLDEHFQQMNLSISSAAQNMPVNPPPATISPSENLNSNWAFGSDDEKSDIRKAPPQQQVSTQPKPAPIDPPVIDSRQVYYQERMMLPPAAAQLNPVPKREIPAADPTATYRVQQIPVPVPESNYIMPTNSAPEQLHPQVQQPQQQQQQQPQYIHANPQYVQFPSYYHQVTHPIQQSQPFNPSIPLYYFPVHQNPPPVTARPLPKVTPKPELQPTMYRSSAAPPAQMIHPGMGYHVMHHHHPSQAPAAAPVAPGPQFVNYGYEYTGNAAGPDAVHQAQVYYTQTTSPPSMPAQYQTGVSEEVKQNRPS